MDTVPTPPESTKTSLRQRLRARAKDRWPQLRELAIRHHGSFAYIGGQLPDGTSHGRCGVDRAALRLGRLPLSNSLPIGEVSCAVIPSR
jgi:hypothetical protein